MEVFNRSFRLAGRVAKGKAFATLYHSTRAVSVAALPPFAPSAVKAA
jgi:hypothetical protein